MSSYLLKVPPSYIPLVEELLTFTDFYNAGKISSFITYNTAGGKGFRADLFNLVHKHDVHKHDVHKQDVHKHDVHKHDVSYVFELLQSALIVIDDVMDKSDLRRGVECYYKKEGLISLRFSQYFISAISRLLRKYNLSFLFNQCLFDTCLGQILDARVKVESDYNMEMYNLIAEYKTSIYSFYLPLKAGYLMRDQVPGTLFEYCRLVGLIFQMQDDYLNFFPELSKKTGNDLEERKLTYFTCKLIKEESDYIYGEVVTDDMVEKVRGYFPEYKEEVKKLMERVEKMGKDIEPGVHELIFKMLKKRNID